jgi:hypothetical protein
MQPHWKIKLCNGPEVKPCDDTFEHTVDNDFECFDSFVAARRALIEWARECVEAAKEIRAPDDLGGRKP